MQDISNYKKLREDADNFYLKIGKVYCPAFNNEPVYFNSKGFNHLIYKSGHTERNRSVQIMKFKLLPKVKKIIQISTTYQEYEESLIEIERYKFKKKNKETVTVKYWAFVAIIQDTRIKVIIRQLGNGQKHFWSVIPAWRISYYKDIKMISSARGNLAED